MPTRPIGWNVSEVAFAVMYVLVAVQALLLAYGGTRRYLMWRRGRPLAGGRIDRVGERLRQALAVTFLHRRLIRPGYLYSGLMHLFIFWGFVVLFIGTLIVLLEADIVRPYFGLSFYQGTFYVAYKLVINLFGLLFLIGLLMAVYRRYGQKLPRFRRSLSDDAIVLGTLLFLGLTGFLLQALRLAATHDPAAPIHWVSYPLALALGGVDPAVLTGAHAVTWWAHMLANTALLVYIPVSKLAHIFTGPANVFLRATEPRAALSIIANIEEQDHFGAAKLADFSWKQLVNFDACMRCGRCLDFCPTFNTGKPLKPRQLIVEIGAYMNRQAGLLAGPAGPFGTEAGVRGSELVDPADRSSLAQVPVIANLIGDVVSEDELWDCTTCRACMEQCPVQIEHVPLIVEMRRNLVLEQS
jgi:ferredoxin/nitrate reductase gamma subunit